jgi:hypothetical protein
LLEHTKGEIMSLELIKGLEVETKLKKEGIALLNVYAD